MSIAEPPCVILLYRAILTLCAVPDPDLRYFVEAGSSWPEYPRRYLDAYNPDEETEVNWRPTPADVTVYLDVLAWARGMSKRQRHIMLLRARDYSLSLIADMLRATIDQVEQDHAEAVQVVVTAAWRAATHRSTAWNSIGAPPQRNLRHRNMWCVPLDNLPQNAAVSRSHHCAQSPVVFSFAEPN